MFIDIQQAENSNVTASATARGYDKPLDGEVLNLYSAFFSTVKAWPSGRFSPELPKSRNTNKVNSNAIHVHATMARHLKSSNTGDDGLTIQTQKAIATTVN
jgi:hypothetical protein